MFDRVRTLPSVYSGATYKTIGSSRNGTHWSIEVVCSGCSRWTSGSVSSTAGNTFAWAVSKTPVSQPGSSSSSFGVHDMTNIFQSDLSAGKNPVGVFQQHVQTATA